MIDWIWIGCALMALGGFVALSDRRYRATITQRRPRQAGHAGQAGSPLPLATGPSGDTAAS